MNFKNKNIKKAAWPWKKRDMEKPINNLKKKILFVGDNILIAMIVINISNHNNKNIIIVIAVVITNIVVIIVVIVSLFVDNIEIN